MWGQKQYFHEGHNHSARKQVSQEQDKDQDKISKYKEGDKAMLGVATWDVSRSITVQKLTTMHLPLYPHLLALTSAKKQLVATTP